MTILWGLQPAPGTYQEPPPLRSASLRKERPQELLHPPRARIEGLWGCELNNLLGRVSDPFTHQSRNPVHTVFEWKEMKSFPWQQSPQCSTLPPRAAAGCPSGQDRSYLSVEGPASWRSIGSEERSGTWLLLLHLPSLVALVALAFPETSRAKCLCSLRGRTPFPISSLRPSP